MVGNVIVGQNLLPMWKIGGAVEYISSNQMQRVPDNGHAVRLGNAGMISQVIHGLKNGSDYSLLFSVSTTCKKSKNLNMTVIPYSQVLSINTSYDSSRWDTYAWGFKAVAEGHEAHEVVLQNPNEDYDNPSCGVLIRGVAIQEIIPSNSKVALTFFIIFNACEGNLVTNGNFEEGPHDYLNGTNGILLSRSVFYPSPLPGWIVESSEPSKYMYSPHFSVPEGRRAVELLSGSESIISQNVATEPGKSYRLSFAMGDGKNACKGPMTVQATTGDKTFRVPHESKGTGGFKVAEFTFRAHYPATRIAFMSLSHIMKSDNSGSLCGPVLDQVQVVAL
eukprot:PITA_11246